MRLPIIPILVAIAILSGAVYVFNNTGVNKPILDAPLLTRLADIDGIETEVALSPDGARCAVIANGDLWLLTLSSGAHVRMTDTPEAESFPAWSPDGRRITFTRGPDTFVLPSDATSGTGEPFKADATNLSWSSSGRQVFVRNRGLWLTDVSGRNEKQIVPTDDNPNVTIHSPRFSPNSLQIAFIKSLLDINGQVWIIDAQDTQGVPARTLVADRVFENPLDVGWVMEGTHLVYLTNRSGAYSLWQIDFAENTLTPLTQPLMGLPLKPIGISTWKDRIVLPRHFEDSNIALSDGKTIVQTDDMELDPSVSPDGTLGAYTVLKDNSTAIWTANVDGSGPKYRTVGSEPRFAPDGFHIVYTHIDLDGNPDIWRIDIRDSSTERLTDAEEIDMTPDPSPDGRWIAFTSTRGIAPSIWVMPASGGQRLRLNEGGYGPRFSPDSRSILYWNNGSLWTMGVDGSAVHQAPMDPAPQPAVGGWSKLNPLQIVGNEIRGTNGTVAFKSERPLWPRFDVLPDGRFAIAPINIHETSIWAVDLRYKNK